MSYNGWKNYETWNVALWIGNDESLYSMARNLRNFPNPYKSFVMALNGFYGGVSSASRYTPDGVSWIDSELDVEALNQMLNEL